MILDIPEVNRTFCSKTNSQFASQNKKCSNLLLFNYSNVTAPFVFAQIKSITLSSVWHGGKVGGISDTTFSLNQIGQLGFQ